MLREAGEAGSAKVSEAWREARKNIALSSTLSQRARLRLNILIWAVVTVKNKLA